MRVIIDTNCFLTILPKVSPYRAVFDAYRKGQFELIISTEILNEYAEIFAQKMTPEISENVIELILNQNNTIKTEIYYRWALITADYDDCKFVDAAISAQADFIVTSDAHFNILRNIAFPRVAVVGLLDFMNLL